MGEAVVQCSGDKSGMINASKEFREKLKNGANVVNYADVTLADGTVLHLEPKDFMVGGCQIEDKTTDGKFGVGFAIGKTATLKIANHDERFSRYDFYQAIINLYVAMRLDDGSIEKIRKGVYYAVVPETPGNIIEISAVDGMYRLDKDYSGSTTSYPATLQTILSDACLDCGIPVGFRQFDNMSFVVSEKPEKATYRQIVSYVCQVAGYNARIDNDGYLRLIWYNTSLLNGYHYDGGGFKYYPHDTVLDGGSFTDYSVGTLISGGNFTDEEPIHIFRIKSLDVSTDDVWITGVRVTGEDKVVELSGEDGYTIEIKENPFVNGKEREVADYLGMRMTGVGFRPFSARVLNNPLYEPFEVVKVSDQKGNVYYSFVNSVSYTIGAYTQISCQAEDPVRNGSTYASPAASAVAEARKNAENQISTYDKAVQNMTQIAMNTLGYHTTYEDLPDGGRVTYLHDRPKLEDSHTIYKIGIDGFFVSQDGGQSYTAGFDKNGNVVVNVLSAIGITFDWARGGVLTLGGADNANGRLRMLDSAGNAFCDMTKDGVSIRSSRLTVDSENFKLSGSGSLSAKGEIETVKENGVSARLRGNGFSLYDALDVEVGRYTATYDASQPNDYSKRGLAIATSTGSVGIGVDAGSKANIYYYMNNGLNPNGLTERHLFNQETRFINTIKLPKATFGNISASYASLSGGSYEGDAVLCDGSIYAYGSIGCSGTKYRIVDTDHYGKVGMNALESAGAHFTDIGSGCIESDKCYIYLDPLFLETIDQNEEYQVLITRTSQEEVYWVKKEKMYFIVHGEKGASFDWMVIAKQKGYQRERMSSVLIEHNMEIPYDESIFYGDEVSPVVSQKYMTEFQRKEEVN